MLNLLLLLYRRYGGHIKDGGQRCTRLGTRRTCQNGGGRMCMRVRDEAQLSVYYRLL